MPGGKDKGFLFIICPKCGYVLDYQIIGPNGAGGRYSGPPSMRSIVEKDHVCPNCRSALRIPSSSELLSSIEILDISTFKDNYSVFMEKDTGIPRFIKPRGLPSSNETSRLSDDSLAQAA